MKCDLLLWNVTVLKETGIQLEKQAVVIADEDICWCGSIEELPAIYKEHAAEFKDCEGQLLTPGFIDCHTHLVFAGDRANEFRRRLEGATYSQIAKEGGGIRATVNATRKASEQELFDQSLPRIIAMANEGVTTVEIKSGYGLDLDTELKMLKVARRLGDETGLRVTTTYLGAHALPPEYIDKQNYIDDLCRKILPQVAESGLADAVDVFCESIAFNLKQTEQIFNAAKKYALPIKCHAEQLSNLGASKLAAQYGALSCDHIEYLDEAGVHAMAEAGTAAVLLPGAYYYLRETRKPPVALLRSMKVPIAIATDCNPGSAPTTSILLMLNMACQFFSLSVSEALSGTTCNAAKALAMDKKIGIIEPGMKADLNLWSIKDSALLCYYFAFPFSHKTIIGGRWRPQLEL